MPICSDARTIIKECKKPSTATVRDNMDARPLARLSLGNYMKPATRSTESDVRNWGMIPISIHDQFISIVIVASWSKAKLLLFSVYTNIGLGTVFKFKQKI